MIKRIAMLDGNPVIIIFLQLSTERLSQERRN